MNTLAAVAAGCAVWGLLPARGLPRLAGPKPTRWCPPVVGFAVLAVGAATVLMWLLAGWAAGLVLLGVAATGLRVAWAGWVRRARRAGEAAAADACQVLAGLLRLGLLPQQALELAAQECEVLAEAAATFSVGGSVAHCLRREMAKPGLAALGELAAAWQVAESSGAGLARTLDALAERIAAAEEVAREVQTELAAPRATGRLLAALPIVGLGLGYALGSDPLAWLLGSVYGEICLACGVWAGCAGLLWSEWIADGPTR